LGGKRDNLTVDRVAKLLECIDVTTDRGLEIGPLHHPVVSKEKAQVFYVDHADTAALTEKYAGHDDVADIGEVDFVWHDRSLIEAVGPTAPYDFVIASHVIEHVPNLVGWLREVADVLRPGGILSLAVPDKRYCFDARRGLTGAGDILDAHLTKRRRATPGAVFDFYSRIVEANAASIWAQVQSFNDPSDEEILRGWQWARKAAVSDEYLDVHCSTFTPQSFVQVLRVLMLLDLVDFEVARFHATEVNELEFHVSLRKLDPYATPAHRRQQQLASLPPEAARRTELDASGTLTLLSRREADLVRAKRRIVGWTRHLLRHLHQTASP
jgi:SAM-dependent methyltransferase